MNDEGSCESKVYTGWSEDRFYLLSGRCEGVGWGVGDEKILQQADGLGVCLDICSINRNMLKMIKVLIVLNMSWKLT